MPETPKILFIRKMIKRQCLISVVDTLERICFKMIKMLPRYYVTACELYVMSLALHRIRK